MLNRREVFLGAAGVLAAGRINRPPITLDLAIGAEDRSTLVRVLLSNMPLETVTGIPASLMRPTLGVDTAWLTMKLASDAAQLALSDSNQECFISLRNGCEGFVASWALPIVQHGIIGYDPGRDLPLLLASGAGEYWCLREAEEAPAAMAKATAAYGCFFGDYEERTLERMQVVVDRFTHAIAPGAHFIFNAVIHPAHEPSVLLTVFAS